MSIDEFASCQRLAQHRPLAESEPYPTVRAHLERYAPGPEGLDEDPQVALAPIIVATEEIVGIRARTGRTGPDVIT